MAKIGVFWIYKTKVIGKACEVYEGQENVPNIIDSPYNHVDLWEHDTNLVISFPELKGSEYQDVPRGRVLYSKKDNKAIVYMDKVLHSEHIKQIISDFFQLSDTDVEWKTDNHYTTDPVELDKLFDGTYP